MDKLRAAACPSPHCCMYIIDWSLSADLRGGTPCRTRFAMSPENSSAVGAELLTSELDHDRYMRRAIELSHKGGIVEKTGGCFGAVVVDAATGEIIGEGYNHVVACSDPTW